MKIFQFNPVAVNTYVLFDETKEAVVIDCGAYNSQEKEQLTDFIKSNDLTIKHLLNTHLHFDHVLGNHFMNETYGLTPEYHEREHLMPGLRKQCAAFGMPVDYEPAAANHFIEEGDIIRFGNSQLQAILTPGHSPGSLSFYDKEHRIVFTGDALFRDSIGRTDLWEGSYDTLVNSIRTKLLTLPGDTIVYPGHGPKTTIQYEKENNPYL